jgi:hypothetical protein
MLEERLEKKYIFRSRGRTDNVKPLKHWVEQAYKQSFKKGGKRR